MTWIKICGITNVEDAQASTESGADALGFVFHPASPRRVDPDRARAIIETLPRNIEKIGVFVNERVDEVARIADQAHLTAVQFHGDEYRDGSQLAVNRRILLSLPCSTVVGDDREYRNALLSLTSTAPNLIAIMIDAGTRERRGGTGTAFDWSGAAASICALQKRYPVVVAGGLTPDNVGQAIGILHPWGVDVSSGVEVRSGKKDAEKLRAFIRAVRLADGKNGNN